MKRLQSKDINWISDSVFAIVSKSDNRIEVQTESFIVLNDKQFTQVGPYGYTSIHHYQVRRDLND